MKRRVLCLIVCILSFFVSQSVCAVDYGTVRVEVPVSTGWLTVEQPQAVHSYRIKMIPLSDMAPAPEEEIITITEGESGKFVIPVIEPGIFKYKVCEEKTTRPNINADITVYEVSIYAEVTTDEHLVTAVTITRNYLSKPDHIYFDDSVSGHTDPYPVPDPDPDKTEVTTGDSTVTDITGEPPEPEDQTDPGEGLTDDDDYIDDDIPEDTVTEVTSPPDDENEPQPDDDKSPIEVIVENLLTPKTGNISIASIATVMGIALAAALLFIPRDKNDK